MADSITTTFSRVWNAFFGREGDHYAGEASYGGRPYRTPFFFGSERSISASLYNRIALDAATITVNHVQVDENLRYLETIPSGLNECLSVSANIDQTAAAFFQDAILTLFEEGVIAIVPVDTTRDPTDSDAWDVRSLRVGKVVAWYPQAVKLDLYNDRTGKRQRITLPKRAVAVVENPLYSVMNEPNSTLKRLIKKLNLLDVVDEASSSGKLDLLIQLPYALKTLARKKLAKERRDDIVDQLRGSEYGIAYTDATEKVVQLNRPSENNLMKQIEFLTAMLYSQLGITEGIMDGTADETTMTNYYKRTVEPVLKSIVDSMNRTFISKTGRTQGQKLMSFADTFKLVPVSVLAEAVDKLARNEILSSNEVRAIIGYKPDKDPKSDELRNSNMPNEDPQAAKGGEDIDEA